MKIAIAVGMGMAGMVVMAAGCANKDAGSHAQMRSAPEDKAVRLDAPARPAEAAPAPEPGTGGGGRFADIVGDRKDEAKEAAERGVLAGGSIALKQQAKAEQTEATPTRSWFPETFLFEPLVVTDDSGAATVPVRVPDRLTTWRVLALGHSRSGAQGGAVTSFLGTLPTYVDPVVPKFLLSGDEVRVPIQLVNTTAAAVTGPLSVEAAGGNVDATRTGVTVPAGGGVVKYALLKVGRPGIVRLRAAFAQSDAVMRDIVVQPTGRPVVATRSGTLAAPRQLTMTGPAGADPASDKLRLLVWPGALALLRSELGASTARSGVSDDAYALFLAGKAAGFLAALGDKVDPDAVRELTLLAGQRAIRDARTLDVASAALLAEAALAHPESPVLTRLGARAAAWLGQNQRPDGTFGGGSGWTLQRVLVTTAECVRAARAADATPEDRQRAQAVTLRAQGAFERHADQVQDGYTAAAILASGAASGQLAETLRGKLRAAVKDGEGGAKYLATDEQTVRPDGTRASDLEATALAVLALAGGAPADKDKDRAKDRDKDVPLADLGATLLGGYGQARGWGDGRTNLVAMQAVLRLFKDPVPANVKITLMLDGKPVIEGTLDRDKLRQVLALDADAPSGLAGAHELRVAAEPPVPGLGFSLSLESWVPWEKESVHAGLELAIPPAIEAQVGKPVEIALQAVAPAGMELHLEQSLPAGVQVETASLDALVSAGTISRYLASDGRLEMWVPALQPGQTFAAKYRAVATLAGKLHSAASSIEGAGASFHVPPTAWTIK
jgi:alpha-2-macroglobulin family protein